MKKRVLHIIGSGTIGGAENFVYQLARYQHMHDDEIETAILFRKGSGHFFERAQADGIPTFCCKEKMGFRQLVIATKRMREFDILHFHGLYPSLFAAALVSGRKSFYYVHGARSLTKETSTILKNMIKPEGWKRFPTFTGLLRFVRRQWFKVFLRYVVAVHAPSQYYVDFYKKNYSVPHARISRLPNGIDFSRMLVSRNAEEIRRELGIKKEKVIGCVSTFRRLKRIDRLIDAFALLLNRRSDLKLLIVGDGLERENIEKQIEALGIGSHIILAGFRTDVANLFNIMDIFVLPSESESFSIAIVEALYFKIPVVGFEGSGGAEEIVRDSRGGKLVKDAGELAAMIAYLFSHSEEAERLADRGHRFALQNYSIKKYAARIKHAYDTAV